MEQLDGMEKYLGKTSAVFPKFKLNIDPTGRCENPVKHDSRRFYRINTVTPFRNTHTANFVLRQFPWDEAGNEADILSNESISQ